MSDTSNQFDDMQFEAAAGGGLIELDAEFTGSDVRLIRAEIAHLRHDADRLAIALQGVFPSQDGLHDIPQHIHTEIDGLEAWLDEAGDGLDVKK
jgi:hypothetical protein